MFLFYDTETTGLPLNWNGPISNLNNWPRLVQLAWILVDEKGIIEKRNFIIKPDGFLIPTKAVQIHKITNERANSIGKDIKKVLKEFINAANKAKYLIAHNAEFDEKVLGSEFYRYGIYGYLNIFNTRRTICTMKSATNYCGIPGARGFKWPTLSELYYKLFKTQLFDSHNAQKDVEATLKCFSKLIELNVINIPEIILNVKTSTMDIKEQAIFLKGFLESLGFSETINDGQIEFLKNKLSELINTITGEIDYGVEDEVDGIVPSPKLKKRDDSSYNDFSEPIDDLPF